MLDSQRVTVSVVLDSWCSEALRRIKLVCYVSDIMCFIRYHVFYNLSCYEPWSRKCTKYFYSGGTNIVFWNQLKILVCFNLQKSPQKSRESQNHLQRDEIAPPGA